MMINTPKELSAALQNTGGEVEVANTLYLHFLEVLPPRKIGPDFFIFQEGVGERLYFERRGCQYFCHLLGNYLVTEDLKIQAAVSRSQISAPFRLLFVYTDEEICDIPVEFEKFVGKEFVSISAIAEAMNVTFRV
jgi:hypothetical protein